MSSSDVVPIKKNNNPKLTVTLQVWCENFSLCSISKIAHPYLLLLGMASAVNSAGVWWWWWSGVLSLLLSFPQRKLYWKHGIAHPAPPLLEPCGCISPSISENEGSDWTQVYAGHVNTWMRTSLISACLELWNLKFYQTWGNSCKAHKRCAAQGPCGC